MLPNTIARNWVKSVGKNRLLFRSLSSATFNQSDLPPCDFKPPSCNGTLSSDRLNEIRKNHVHPAIFHYYKTPLTLDQGHMQYLFDDKGQRYIDCLGGFATLSAGHCHPRVVEALEKQSKKLWHVSTIYNYEPWLKYVEKLASKFPDPLKVVYLVNSGSEANDLAILMARMYTGNQDIVSLRGAYHGISPYLMPLASIDSWRHNASFMGGHHLSKCPDPYRGPWGGRNCRNSPSDVPRDCDCEPGVCKACDAYVEDFEDLLTACTNKTKMAGFIAESIQGAGGTCQFPKGYLKRVYEMVRARNGLCIADEVQTGFGRTGESFWAFESHGVVPDIVTTAKSIGNGFPIAAVVTRREVAEVLSKAVHFNTFGGNPMACSVASTVLDVIDDEKLQQNCKEVGTYLLQGLMNLQKKHRVIGDVRGLGFMLGIEFVTDPVKKTPLPVNELMEKMKEKFVLVGRSGRYGQVIRFKPPMCLNKKDVDYIISALDASLVELGYK